MQSSRADPVLDRLRGEPKAEQLPARHHSMLPPRDSPSVPSERLRDLGPHRDPKFGEARTLPPTQPTFLPGRNYRRFLLSRCSLGARRLAEGVGAVRPLPGEVLVGAAEVAVGGGLLEDRAVEV